MTDDNMVLNLVILVIILLTWYKTADCTMPMKLTRVDYYYEKFHWNKAYEHCTDDGGHLLQPETETEARNYRLLIRDIRKDLNKNSVEIWLGMVVAKRNQAAMTWVGPCSPVCYDDFGWGEPNYLYLHLCIRIVQQEHHTGNKDTEEWKTTHCGTISPGFLCIHETTSSCPYISLANTNASVSSIKFNVYTESYVTPVSSCQQYCDSRVLCGQECWGFAYTEDTGVCLLLFTRTWKTLTKSDNQYTEPNTTLYMKDCFEVHLKGTTTLSSSAIAQRDPISPCYGNTPANCPATTTGFCPTSAPLLAPIVPDPTSTTNGATTVYSTTTLKTTSSPDFFTSPTSTKQPDVTVPEGVYPDTTTRKEAKKTNIITTPRDTITKSTNIITKETVTTSETWLTTSSSILDASTIGALSTKQDRCFCPCAMQNHINVSKEIFTKHVLKFLEINKTTLSSSVRKHVSVYERRPMAVGIGSVWVILLLVCYGFLFLSDIFCRVRKVDKTNRGYGYGKRKVRPVNIQEQK